MKEDRDIKVQIHEYQTLLDDLKSVQIELPEPFIAEIFIEKLPESWREYRRDLKHNFERHKSKQEDANRKETPSVKQRNILQMQTWWRRRTKEGMEIIILITSPITININKPQVLKERVTVMFVGNRDIMLVSVRKGRL
ncbi:unnamed protein product [Cuscuta europaea]|uniref:Uncharacterized protein n=1 Tax=Cuscuta europaea TaxID=41803 RepID=A0A9P1EHR6_CUSEU|nr:unnamed protein product [Cuscuta europaea]